MSATTGRAPRREPADRASRVDAERLAALARDCELAGIERHCFLLRLSALPADLAKPHHLRLAADALDPLNTAERVQRFALPNNDIAVVWRGGAVAAVETVASSIADLFADSDGIAPDPATLWQLLILPGDSDALHSLIEASIAGTEPTGALAGEREPLDPAALTILETALTHADVARFARRRSICTLSAVGMFQAQWETRYLSVEELAAELSPDRALEADPWLFRRLTHTLDRRLLALLASADELRGARPFGLDLNVASILSAEFMRFDNALPQDLRGQVTLGLLAEDILADLPAYLFARDYVRSRGYRMKLVVPSVELLPVVPIARLGLDLMELHWSLDLTALDPEFLRREAELLVLGRADAAEAIVWGRLHGISRFEGRAAQAGRRVYRPALTRA